MIEELLPPGVTSSEAFDDAAPAPLFPAEAALMEGRRARRRRQFATARACARRCLAQLGRRPGPPQPGAGGGPPGPAPRAPPPPRRPRPPPAPPRPRPPGPRRPVPLLPGPGGAPQWPTGVVGSITHCDGYRGAVAARSSSVSALGIDAEPAGPLPKGVLNLITSAEERTHLTALTTADPSLPWDRIFFSAKEAAYKAWYPATGIWLGFRDATLALSPDGTFTTTLHPPTPTPVNPVYEGRWLAGPDLVLTAVARSAGR
ncbi:4'-phosphopantetheinyl transferase [Streptomyces sp. NPDC059447]|uniref:4'-phosphopantetheinyl transferase family protein n=1 Tax=Streptomyces sp. NPDC059447 TaxID=3346834 RepID=UPI0036C4C7E7